MTAAGRARPRPGDADRLIPLASALADRARWADLAGEATDPGLFSGPAMIGAAAGTIAPDDWRIAQVEGEDGALDALLAVRTARAAPLVGPRLLEGFWSHYGPRTPPLLRPGRPDAARRLVARLAEAGSVLRLHHQALDGPAVAALAADAAADGRHFEILDRRSRARLDAGLPPEDAVGPLLRGNRLRDLARRRRRLAERGRAEDGRISDPDGIAEAVEAFLALEAAGWRGTAGGAAAARPERIAFLRRFTAELADEGRIAADVIRLDGRIVAVMLVLFSSDAAFTWKVAHEGALAAVSPGVLVSAATTDRCLADPAIAAVDSLAVPDHPVMDKLWAGRLPIGTVILALRPEANALARRAARLHRRYHAVRDLVRRLRDRVARGGRDQSPKTPTPRIS